jgi:ribosomal-protein-alanine N-acetyltransferase
MQTPPRPTIPKLDEIDIVLQTPRLVLRPFRDGDVDEIWPWVSDPAFPRAMSWAAHVDRSETRAFIQDGRARLAHGTAITWAIEHEGRASGCISLENIRWQQRTWRTDRAELGYWLAPPLWGHGLMTEAAQAIVRFGFDVLSLHKITVGCLADNDGSRRVIEKVGFRAVGKLEEDVWRDGKWHAHLRYELVSSEWDDTTSTRRFVRR